jgi:hypothetical protein
MSHQGGVAELNSHATDSNGLEHLQRAVQDEMGSRVRAFELVRRDDGGLILKGRTRTYYAKQMAQHLVMRSSNEPILANEIEVT